MALLKSTGNKKVNLDFNKEFINTFSEKIQNGHIEFINQTLKDLHEADVANLIENLNPNTRVKLIELEEFNINPEIFVELNESIQSEVLQLLSTDSIIKIIKTNRGGKITLHNPGQKIIYFVINLNNRKKDIRKFINTIEVSVIEFLKFLKINAKKDKKNIGIWVKGRKIAAIGLRVSRWVAFHGFSINISNNLKEYLKIVPCGLNNKKITSVYSERKLIPKNFENKLVNIFIKNINSI